MPFKERKYTCRIKHSLTQNEYFVLKSKFNMRQKHFENTNTKDELFIGYKLIAFHVFLILFVTFKPTAILTQ